MVLENVCAPALLYLAFSIIQIIIDMYRGETVQAFFKFIVMIIFTIVLNAICNSGMTIISWFIVFIPFILMTYITTILFFIFGINPSSIQSSNKKCSDTQFGCCDDGVTAKEDMHGRSCPRMRLANVLKVSEPTAANNKDGHYLYPEGRRWRDYSIGGGSLITKKDYKDYKEYKKWKKSLEDKDELYYSKGQGWKKKNTSPKSMGSRYSYWKSKLNKSDWDDEKEHKKYYDSYSTPNEIQKIIIESGKTIVDTIKITKEVFVITKAVTAKMPATGATDAEITALNKQKAAAAVIESAAVAANNEADDALILVNSAETVDLVKAAQIAADKAKTNATKAKVDATALKTSMGTSI
jgi:hypothetical protein